MCRLSLRHLLTLALLVFLSSPLCLLAFSGLHTALFTPRAHLPAQIVRQVQVGDLVFIREPYLIPREIARAGGSWSNHVGIVVDTSGTEPMIAESRIPRVRLTSLTSFVHRSEAGYVAVMRLKQPLSIYQQGLVASAARKRVGKWYDLGFDLHSSRQFCSKLVYESLVEAVGYPVARTNTLGDLRDRNPDLPTGLWKLWFLGRVPWQRVTLTPAALYHSEAFNPLYDSTSHAAAARLSLWT